MSDANTAINTVSVDCPAKTNLTLHVGRPRSEWGGRHELDTIYCAVGVYDTVTTSRKKPGSGFSLNLEGAYLGDLASSGSDMRRNHAVLALFAMAEASGHEPDVALNIEKRIPGGAGMAGGSADAAATILALNTLWNLDWSIERLQQVAATLGADMPFCLTGGYARGTGFGEQIEQLSENSDAVLELTDQGFAGRRVSGGTAHAGSVCHVRPNRRRRNRQQSSATGVDLTASTQRTGDRRSVAGRRQAGVRLRIRPFRNRIRANRRCGTRRAVGMATKPLRRPHHRHQGTGPSDCAYHRVTVRLKSTDFWRRTRT